MLTLVICDDHWHPASTARAGLGELGDCGLEFDWIENAGEWSAERMAEYPLEVFAKSNDISATDQRQWVTEEVQQAFVDYVRRGNGLLVIHSGTVYAQQPVLRGLMGGAFIRHPDQCPVTVEPQEGHPLAAGSTLLSRHCSATPCAGAARHLRNVEAPR